MAAAGLVFERPAVWKQTGGFFDRSMTAVAEDRRFHKVEKEKSGEVDTQVRRHADGYKGESDDLTETEEQDMEVFLAKVNAILRGAGHHCVGNRVMQMWQAVRRPPYGQELDDEHGPGFGDFHVPSPTVSLAQAAAFVMQFELQ
jgi:hypothetical protein